MRSYIGMPHELLQEEPPLFPRRMPKIRRHTRMARTPRSLSAASSSIYATSAGTPIDGRDKARFSTRCRRRLARRWPTRHRNATASRRHDAHRNVDA